MPSLFSIGQIKLRVMQPPDLLGGHLLNLCNPHPRMSLIVVSIN